MHKPHEDGFFGIDYEITTCLVCVSLNQFEERDLNMPPCSTLPAFFRPGPPRFIPAPHPQFASAARVCGFAKIAVYMPQLYI